MTKSADISVSPSPVSRYTVCKPTFKHSYHITSETSQRKYVRTRAGTSAPGLTLHDGPDETAPVLAVVHGIKSQSNLKIGLGDPEDPNAVTWEYLHHDNAIKTKFSFEFEVDHVRKRFTWKRTRTEAVEGGTIVRMSPNNWKLVGDEEVLAVFTSDKAVGIAGVLQVNVDHGVEFATMVLISVIALLERARRSGG